MSEQTVYVIRDWNRIYENNRSREVQDLRWVSMPNKHDSLGFRMLLARPNGMALYGAWCVIVQVASKCSPRGVLVKNGKPLTPELIAVVSGAPADIIRECLEVAQDPDIGWLSVEPADGCRPGDVEVPSGCRPGDVEVPADCQPGDVEVPTRARASFPSVLSVSSTPDKKLKPSTETSAPDLEVSGENPILGEVAQRMYERHPKAAQLCLLLPALEKAMGKAPLSEIEECHKAWSETPNWVKESGRYAPKIVDWLDNEGFRKWPAGKKPAAPAKPLKVVPYDPEWWKKEQQTEAKAQ